MAGSTTSSSLPAKKPKVKAARPATAIKGPLSAKSVADSDDSEGARITTVKKPASKTSRSETKSSKPAAPKPSISQAKPSKKRKSPSPSPAKDDASGSGSEEDEDSQDEERPTKKRLLVAKDGSPTPKPNTVAVRPVPAKLSIKPSTNVKPMDRKNERGPGATRDEPNNEVGGSSEYSSSGSESGSGSGSESESGSSDKTSLQSPRKQSPVQKSVPQQITPIYDPPAGFESTSISIHPASKLSEILAPSNLEGKQIWHITAPESVPISLVKEVSIQNIGNGAPVLKYDGANYGLVPELEAEQASSRALLLPSTQGNSYRPAKNTIIKTLNLQQLVSLPSHALEPAVHPNRSASASESYKKVPRQQPEGLRMRYHPFGASDGSDSEPSSEPAPKAPQFRVPARVQENSPVRKRKRPDLSDDVSDSRSAVKSQKRKRTRSPRATARAKHDPMDIDGIRNENSESIETPIESLHPVMNGANTHVSLPNGNETKEARRKRKEKEKEKLEHRDSPPKPATALPLDMKQDAEKMQPGEVVESVPAIANAVEGASSISVTSPRKESKEEKAKRKEERRRRKETKRASRGASSLSAQDTSQQELPDSQDQMMQEIETAQREASIRILTPREGSPQKVSRIAHESRNSALDSGQALQRKEMKEENANRKEEKRRRRRERECGSA